MYMYMYNVYVYTYICFVMLGRVTVRSGCSTEVIRLTVRISANGTDRLQYGTGLRYVIRLTVRSGCGSEFGLQYGTVVVRNEFR